MDQDATLRMLKFGFESRAGYHGVVTERAKAPRCLRGLVLRPPEDCPLVAELAASLLATESPVDADPIAIHPAAPGANFAAQDLEIREPANTQTLLRQRANLDFRLVKPAPMLRGINFEKLEL